jgi:hypothetical protein
MVSEIDGGYLPIPPGRIPDRQTFIWAELTPDAEERLVNRIVAAIERREGERFVEAAKRAGFDIQLADRSGNAI